ncbi:MAG: hypothetical protein K1X94_37060 [Sandaracinaceae bacterium]|nr:hypothetical protein [Sandaracinaceae bacterium]
MIARVFVAAVMRSIRCLVVVVAASLILVHGPVVGASAQEAALEQALASRSLGPEAIVARTVYTWTTEAQAAELSRTRQLLTRGASGGVIRSPYQRALDAIARDPAAEPGDAVLARLLTSSPELGARRYAWITPYGTAVPRGVRSYGPILVAITLDPDAVYARVAPSERPAFRLVDGAGRAVSPHEIEAAPSRLASVLHVRADDPQGGYREIVVHGGVRCWAMGTSAVVARIDDDRRVIAQLAREAHPRRALSLAPYWSAVAGADAARRWTARWALTMPFDTPRHRLSVSALSAIEALLAVRHRQRIGPVVEGADSECAALR